MWLWEVQDVCLREVGGESVNVVAASWRVEEPAHLRSPPSNKLQDIHCKISIPSITTAENTTSNNVSQVLQLGPPQPRPINLQLLPRKPLSQPPPRPPNPLLQLLVLLAQNHDRQRRAAQPRPHHALAVEARRDPLPGARPRHPADERHQVPREAQDARPRLLHPAALPPPRLERRRHHAPDVHPRQRVHPRIVPHANLVQPLLAAAEEAPAHHQVSRRAVRPVRPLRHVVEPRAVHHRPRPPPVRRREVRAGSLRRHVRQRPREAAPERREEPRREGVGAVDDVSGFDGAAGFNRLDCRVCADGQAWISLEQVVPYARDEPVRPKSTGFVRNRAGDGLVDAKLHHDQDILHPRFRLTYLLSRLLGLQHPAIHLGQPFLQLLNLAPRRLKVLLFYEQVHSLHFPDLPHRHRRPDFQQRRQVLHLESDEVPRPLRPKLGLGDGKGLVGRTLDMPAIPPRCPAADLPRLADDHLELGFVLARQFEERFCHGRSSDSAAYNHHVRFRRQLALDIAKRGEWRVVEPV
ncbi:hypothetical protein AK830_g1000 [Neonectria ditissima]|uniref:Uncharacterized protein n=1 Tax=Neonectria ditissima TaxID=78410 RepID=A0A0P7BG50_9HYPO|nr:hypothetical protein AK830_g1000 [Neonectria ditissima]